ncbi:MAG: hypothetical protein WAW57_15215 [Lutibacter sp.]
MLIVKEHTQSTLTAFNNYVIQQARTNLTKGNRNVSKKLYDSLKGSVHATAKSFESHIEMEFYGQFQDKGVKGVGGTKKDGSTWKMKNANGSPFSYKDKMPPIKAFDKWIVNRGFAPRNVKGQFQTREGMKYAIAKSIYHTGIEATHFFTKPFEKAFSRLPDDIVEAYGLDVEDFLKFTLKK